MTVQLRATEREIDCIERVQCREGAMKERECICPEEDATVGGRRRGYSCQVQVQVL